MLHLPKDLDIHSNGLEDGVQMSAEQIDMMEQVVVLDGMLINLLVCPRSRYD